ncbi:MAG: hypothetical protein RLZ98_1665 [Pseudomonadota bacterium]|jgi:peptide/nickel transport system ATP-binding protein
MNMMVKAEEPVLQVKDLRAEFETPAGVVRAVNGVSFELRRGERLAIVGESGSGKSAMAMSIVRLLAYPGKVVGGDVRLGQRCISDLADRQLNEIRGREVSTIFQDPMSSLDPVMRVSDQMIPPIERHLVVDRVKARETAVSWLEKVGIPDAKARIDAYPFEMSGGMRQRVMIAMALSCNPSVVIADEPTTALDVTIQAQIVELLKSLTAETGAAMLFITHDLGLVARFAHKVGVMYAGCMVEFGTVEDVFKAPRHPYTQSLLRTIPDTQTGQRRRLQHIPGFPPDMRQPMEGCAFKDRCPAAHARCSIETPELEYRSLTQSSACWLIDGLNDRGALPDAADTRSDYRHISKSNFADRDVLEINNLHKHFVRRPRLPWGKPSVLRAVNGVSLRLRRGETLGLVGESGCGKSTVARLLLGLERPTSGDIFLSGIAQMVFQDPSSSFNPKMTVFSIIEEPLVVKQYGTRAERAERVRELLDRVGLEQSFLHRYPNELSGGQRQRVGVARALALNPSVVVADEPTSALDISVRAQIINLLCDLKRELAISFVFISHDLLTVRYISDRIAVMYLGEIVEYGTAEEVFARPRHPYTRALLDAIPTPDPVTESEREVSLLEGDLPSPLNIPAGCAFASRCPRAMPDCLEEKPSLIPFAQQRQVACHHPIG